VTVSGALLDGRYRLITPIAAGGMSVVWRGHDDVLARPIAVKVLASAEPGAAGDPMFAERVRREAMAIARISHPYIANVYDYGESAEPGGVTVPYIVMELVEGESLAQVLTRGRLSWPTAAGICAQVAAALAAAHQLGVVHQDVTPSNVMLCVDGVKVVDFGISATTGQRVEASEQVFGTPAYLAPERLSGGPAQSATDVYGLGLLLYEAITGHLPWSAATTTQMLTAHRYQPPAPLPPVAGMPPQVAALCARTLAVDPGQRPSSAQVCGELATLAREGDPRARPSLQGATTTVVVETRTHTGTRVMPHGETHFVDPDTSTAPMKAPVAHGSASVRGPRTSHPGTPATRPPTAPPIRPARGRAPAPRRQRGVFILPAVLLLLLVGCLGWAELHQSDAPVPTPTVTPTAPGVVGPAPTHAKKKQQQPVSKACSARYAYTSQWIVGFTAQVTFVNRGTAALAGWALTFEMPSGMRVAGGWNGQWQQSGGHVTVHDVVYNRSLPVGGSVTIGFLGTSSPGSQSPPRHFSLNGTSCK
jgi:serine/threonine protein kinase